jgi:hypothetical protein
MIDIMCIMKMTYAGVIWLGYAMLFLLFLLLTVTTSYYC